MRQVVEDALLQAATQETYGDLDATRRVVLRFVEHMSEHYSGDMYLEQSLGYLAQMLSE